MSLIFIKENTHKIRRYICEHGLIPFVLFFMDEVRNAFNMRFTYRLLHAKNSYIGHKAIIKGMPHIKIGSNFHAKEMLWIDALSYYRNFVFNPEIRIGDNVSLSRNVHIAATGKIYIDNGVMIGSNVLISDHQHGYYGGAVQSHPSIMPSLRPLSVGRPIHIKENVWLGDGVVVFGGVTIGEGAVIGANSIVNRDINPYTINVGSPSRSIKNSVSLKINGRFLKGVERMQSNNLDYSLPC